MLPRCIGPGGDTGSKTVELKHAFEDGYEFSADSSDQFLAKLVGDGRVGEELARVLLRRSYEVRAPNEADRFGVAAFNDFRSVYFTVTGGKDDLPTPLPASVVITEDTSTIDLANLAAAQFSEYFPSDVEFSYGDRFANQDADDVQLLDEYVFESPIVEVQEPESEPPSPPMEAPPREFEDTAQIDKLKQAIKELEDRNTNLEAGQAAMKSANKTLQEAMELLQSKLEQH